MANVMNNMMANGKAVFLLPESKLKTNESMVRAKLLSKHSLRSIIKLPEIFDSVAGVGSVALFVFETGRPQQIDDKVLCYWIKDDGFETGRMFKNQGRVDSKHI